MRTVAFVYKVNIPPEVDWLPDYFFATREAAKSYLKGIGYKEFEDEYVLGYPVVDFEE